MLVKAYIAARKGPGNYRYAGILHPGRGKSEGTGGGSNFHTTCQAKILKPIHIKTYTAKARPLGQHSDRADAKPPLPLEKAQNHQSMLGAPS